MLRGLVQGPAALSSAWGAGSGGSMGIWAPKHLPVETEVKTEAVFSEDVQPALSAALLFTWLGAGGALAPASPGSSWSADLPPLSPLALFSASK